MFQTPENTRITLSVTGLIAICSTVVFVFLYTSVPSQYRGYLTVFLLLMGVVTLVVILRGKWNEQQLRQTRFNPNSELPLDTYGEPYYLPAGAQVNENHRPFRSSVTHE